MMRLAAHTAALDYPVKLVSGWESCADVFAAGFLGENSARHLLAAGVPNVTLVDEDADKLDLMEKLPGWTTHAGDAFEWLYDQQPRSFDGVVLDPWTGPLMDKVFAYLPRFADIARRGLLVGADSKRAAPEIDGWEMTRRMHRSDFRGGIYWLVMEWT